MPDVMFTDLAAATEFSNSDVYCLARGVDSLQLTRAQILIGMTGESIALLHPDGGAIVFNGAGDADYRTDPGGDIVMRHAGETYGFKIDGSGNVSMTAETPNAIYITLGSGTISIDYLGQVHISSGTVNTEIQYYPTNTSDWSYFTVPFDLMKAVDAIARDLAIAQGAPIVYP